MSTIRDPNKDKLKSQSILKEQIKLDCKCKLEDCNNPITMFEGPGSDSYCREHQLDMVEYGTGLGKADRPHTFYRGWVCVKCKYDPREDPQFDDIEDPFHKLRCMRGVMHGDHLKRKSDGGADTKENIQTLCCRCHMIKTYKEKDYLKGNTKVLPDSTELNG
jgi:hypothetical protein